jgi:hypothetical protein
MEVTFVIGQISLVSVTLLLVSFLIIANHFSKLLRKLERPKQWEYTIDGMDFGGDIGGTVDTFNRLGAEGWEATTAWAEPPGDTKGGRGLSFVLFKRPI